MHTEESYDVIELGIQSRFSGAEYAPFINQIPICTIGAGGIGSPFHLIISRMNPRRIVNYEGDIVEIHNLGGQIFSLADIDRPKAEATGDRLLAYSDYSNFIPMGWFDINNNSVLPVMFMCVDNNEVRLEAALKWKQEAERNDWKFKVTVEEREYEFEWVMFDGRLSFNSFDVYVITKDNIDYHIANRLPISEEEILPPNCTTKANPEVGIMTATFMVTNYRNWVQNQINICDEFPISKNVPYRFNANLATLNFKTYELRKRNV